MKLKIKSQIKIFNLTIITHDTCANLCLLCTENKIPQKQRACFLLLLFVWLGGGLPLSLLFWPSLALIG